MNLNEHEKSYWQRITQARKENRFTIKVLAERTGLGAARIENWKQGTRSPGRGDATFKRLNISGAWLLCLTDDPRGLNTKILFIQRILWLSNW